MDEIGAALVDYKAMVTNLETCKIVVWADKYEATYKQFTGAADVIKRTASMSLTILTTWWEGAKQIQRSSDNNKIYQTRKVNEFLIEGGWDEQAGSTAASFLE